MRYLVCLTWLACATATATAFDEVQEPTAHVVFQVTDLKKVEDKAVTILRNKYGLTLAEARAKLRVDGRTDVARCVEYILTDAAANASPYLKLESIQIELAH